MHPSSNCNILFNLFLNCVLYYIVAPIIATEKIVYLFPIHFEFYEIGNHLIEFQKVAKFSNIEVQKNL